MTQTITTTNTRTTPMTATRTCAQCEGPIPTRKIASAKFCHPNCSRVATYQRKSPEARAEINRRSNRRRFEQDLLPILRSISKTPEIPAGHPVAIFVVRTVLLEGMKSWKWELALNFNQAREALATLAGGFDALDRIQDELFEDVLARMDTHQQPQQRKAAAA